VTHLPRTKGTASGAKLQVIVRAFKELLLLWKELRDNPQPRAQVDPPAVLTQT
jgi:hypothetical protein